MLIWTIVGRRRIGAPKVSSFRVRVRVRVILGANAKHLFHRFGKVSQWIQQYDGSATRLGVVSAAVLARCLDCFLTELLAKLVLYVIFSL